MNIYSISAAAVCISVVILCVKNIKSETGHMISIASVVVITAFVIPYIIKIIMAMEHFASISGSGEKYLEPILKITGIAYISQIGSELCSDSGEKALAGRVETAGKIAICTVALPIAKEAFVKIIGILS